MDEASMTIGLKTKSLSMKNGKESINYNKVFLSKLNKTFSIL